MGICEQGKLDAESFALSAIATTIVTQAMPFRFEG
jgi:hypothetical protein